MSHGMPRISMNAMMATKIQSSIDEFPRSLMRFNRFCDPRLYPSRRVRRPAIARARTQTILVDDWLARAVFNEVSEKTHQWTRRCDGRPQRSQEGLPPSGRPP